MSGHVLPETPVPKPSVICPYCDAVKATDGSQTQCFCGTDMEMPEGRMLRKVLDRLGKMGEDIRRVEWKLDQLRKEDTNMADSVAALQTAVAALQAAVTAEDTGIAAIIAALQAASPTGDNPAIDAVVTQLTSLQTDITNQTNAINAAVTPPDPAAVADAASAAKAASAVQSKYNGPAS
jgi:phage-related tail protein